MSTEILHEMFNKHGQVFTRAELSIRGGDVDKTSPELIRNIFEDRAWHGLPTFLSSVYRDGDTGTHGLGEATDQILFKKGAYMRQPIDPLQLWTLSNQWPWYGVGLYLDWRFTNRDTGDVQRTPGIHKDVHQGGVRSRPLRWVAWTLNANRELATLDEIQDRDVDTKRYFYYQSTKDGLFYNAELGQQYDFRGVMDVWKRIVDKDRNEND